MFVAPPINALALVEEKADQRQEANSGHGVILECRGQNVRRLWFEFVEAIPRFDYWCVVGSFCLDIKPLHVCVGYMQSTTVDSRLSLLFRTERFNTLSLQLPIILLTSIAGPAEYWLWLMWMRDETLLTFVHFLYRKYVFLRTYCVRSY